MSALNKSGQNTTTAVEHLMPSQKSEKPGSAKKTGNVVALEQKIKQCVNQYIPSDTLQLDNSLKPAQKNTFSTRTFSTPIGAFQFETGPLVNRKSTSVDVLATLFCFVIVHLMHWGSLNLTSGKTLTVIVALVAMVATLAAGDAISTRKRNLVTELTELWLCWACASAGIALTTYTATLFFHGSTLWISTSMMATLLSLVGIRLIRRIKFVLRNQVKAKQIVVCGNAANIKQVMHSLYGLSNSPVKVLKVFEFEPQHTADVKLSCTLSSVSEQICFFVESQRQSGTAVEQVWVAASTNQNNIVNVLSDSLINHPLDICIAPNPFANQLLNGHVSQYGETEIVNVSEIALPAFADRWKRVFDFCVASIALIGLSIPMVIIAIIVKTTSPGPALFRQKRYGVHGQPIEVFKFRSMTIHADSQVKQATKNDSRVTAIGKIIRRTSLDELPQLFNVLNGSMSLVGPRPHAVAHNEYWKTQIRGYMTRHKVRPGITGWAQINGWRGETDKAFKMQQRVKHDLEYIKAWSPLLDIKIMLLTVVKGFLDKNAY